MEQKFKLSKEAAKWFYSDYAKQLKGIKGGGWQVRSALIAHTGYIHHFCTALQTSVFQEMHTSEPTTAAGSCTLPSQFPVHPSLKAPKKPPHQAKTDWWVAAKHYLSNWSWTSPSKSLSTQLFAKHVAQLVPMNLLLKILLHLTHLPLEGTRMEPICLAHVSQALTLFCSILPCCKISTTLSCNQS